MGRIRALGTRRGALLGIVAIAGLVVAGCVPFKEPPPVEQPAQLIQICAPINVAAPSVEAEREIPAERPCVPFCLPGQEPTPPEASPFVQPELPSCVPICGLDGGGEVVEAARQVPCVQLPVPCLPGQTPPSDTKATVFGPIGLNCVNFCLPGEGPPPVEEFAQVARRCVPLCALADVIRGVPGLEPCADER
jgi:hypothetical protein